MPKYLKPLRGVAEGGVVLLAGKITVNTGSVAPTDTIVGASVTRLTTGSYRLTFDDSYVSSLAAHLTSEGAGSTTSYTFRVSGSNVTGYPVTNGPPAKTLDFMVLSGSTQTVSDPIVPLTGNFSVFLKHGTF